MLTAERGLHLQDCDLYLDAFQLPVLVFVRQAEDRLADQTGQEAKQALQNGAPCLAGDANVPKQLPNMYLTKPLRVSPHLPTRQSV